MVVKRDYIINSKIFKVLKNEKTKMQHFKRHTAKEIINLLEKGNVTTILDQLKFYKRAHRTKTKHQVWQERFQPQLVRNENMMIETVNYIHQNPVKRGYVDDAVHWRYSSARDYEGTDGIIEIDKSW
jgi:REP element-mobilizing transposase RayT